MPLPSTRFVAVALSMLMPTLASAASWEGHVSKVTDGDTLTVTDDAHSVVIRIAEIDAPEDGQGWGKQARRALADLVADQIVTVDERDTDKYGRTVAHLVMGRIRRGRGAGPPRSRLALHPVQQ